jgi:hypothetical protein
VTESKDKEKAVTAKQGDWVRIHSLVLTAEQRSPQVPEDTARVPLQMWDKGFLLNAEAAVGDDVEVETIIGRKVKGTLLEIEPVWDHDFGRCVPEIFSIDRQLKAIMKEEA